MKTFVITLLLIFSTILCLAQETPLKFRIYLIGDGGELTNGSHPIVEDVRKKLLKDTETKSHVIKKSMFYKKSYHLLPTVQITDFSKEKYC